MKFIFTGRHIEVTDGLKTRVTDKFSKLDKFFASDAEAHVTLGVQKEAQTVEATIHSDNLLLRVVETSPDMYVSVDMAVDAFERQLRKHKTRLAKKLRKGAEPEAFAGWDGGEEEEEFRIVKTKTFGAKPMSAEEAILQMNLLKHAFFVFNDARSGGTNVVYKRKDGDYGLIEIR
jgi:putative sigma-54 modulation protein